MQTVMITGAASGIGRAAAQRFARAGWRCVLVDRDGAALAQLCADLPGAPVALAMDLTRDPLDLPADLGPVDALVNNAGISDSSGIALTDQPWDQLDRVLALNLQAPARMVAALGARLGPGARVVNVASGAGLRAIPFRGAYSASKAGMIAQSRALARQRPDLCVTVLCPGFVRTELVDSLIAAGRIDPARAVAKIPLGRMASPEEMAEAIRFLASPAAAILSGGVLALDGGSSIYGGSIDFAPATFPVAPLRMATAFTMVGDAGLRLPQPATGATYPAMVDATPLQAGAGQVLVAVHDAARGFAAAHDQGASLTLILPPEDPGAPWALAGDLAAARMLVASLACELGARGLRVNALQPDPAVSPAPLAEVIGYVGGAAAQFLTGQVLDLKA